MVLKGKRFDDIETIQTNVSSSGISVEEQESTLKEI
jgi:hypothetical protein